MPSVPTDHSSQIPHQPQQTSSSRPPEPASNAPDESKYGLARAVFGASVGTVVLCLAFALILPHQFNAVIGAVNTVIVNSIGWYYVLIVTGFVVFGLVVAFSKLGTVKLGNDDDEPEYGVFPWFAMLFAAGMGIGLVFWGAAEPLKYLTQQWTPPGTANLSPSGHAQRALTQTFLHWGIHAWAIYVVVGLAVAYATHRRGRPISIRWALEPVLGRYTNSWIGDLIDISAVVGTLFGVATSLGFGVNQITAGLAHLGLVPDNAMVKIIIVIVITALAILSVVSGLDKGIKLLSNTNMGLAALLLVAVLVLGPTLILLREFVSGIGSYIQNFVQLSFQTFPFNGEAGETWLANWTTNYWGWWISWSPFVGVFIARISRGRTVREFIVGVLLVPTLVTVLWFTVLGGTAIYQQLFEGKGLISDGNVDVNTVLFDMLNNLPGGPVLSGLAIILVTIFFITSADSGAFVVDMIAHRGDPQPPRLTRFIWAAASGGIAAVLIGISATHGEDTSGMSALQALTLLAAAPFSVVMIGMCLSVLRSLKRDVLRIEKAERAVIRRELVEHVADQLDVAPPPRPKQLRIALRRRHK
ncbi:BCCT family transporter [Devriesea agamarum]|uniref:BCCT family transporter n=1 Tax=Devriesea agamarum TaxID=472569 RepID=UPI0009FFD943|nr:BCCT family transporter [Devriesea agamarum]